MLIVSILSLLFLGSCSEVTFEENIYTAVDSTVAEEVLGYAIPTLNLSNDTVEVGEQLVFSISSQEMVVDSTFFSFDGDSIPEIVYYDLVKTYIHSYADTGTFQPIINIHLPDTTFYLQSKIVVMPIGYDLDLDTIAIDTLDSIGNLYEEDTNLSIGSRPIIGYKDGGDTLFLNAGTLFSDPGAYAFDDEDGEIDEVLAFYSDELITLSNSLTPPTETFITYRVKDSHGNTATRQRLCIISNDNFQYRYNIDKSRDTVMNDYYDEEIDKDITKQRLTQDSVGIFKGYMNKFDSSKFAIIAEFDQIIADTTQSIFHNSVGTGYNMIHLYTFKDSIGLNITDNGKTTYKNRVHGLVSGGNSVVVTMNDTTYDLYINGVKALTVEMDYHIRYLTFGYTMRVGSNMKGKYLFQGTIKSIEIFSSYFKKKEIDYMEANK